MKCEYNAARQWDFRENFFIEGLIILISLPEIAVKCVPYNRMTI